MNTEYSFGKILKEIRQSKNMTQSRLAELLGISPQSISKWENGVGYPDFSLIAPLCSIFEVTTDYILGVQTDQKKAEIDSAIKKWDELWREDGDTANFCVELWKNLLKKYPTDNICRYYLAFQLSCSDNAEKKKEACVLFETILDECTDGKIRSDALSSLVYTYGQLGETKLAIKHAKSSVMPYASLPNLMTNIANNPEANHWHQYIIWESVGHLVFSISNQPYENDKDAIFALRTALRIIDMVCYNRPYTYFDSYHTISIRRELCWRLMKSDKYDEVFDEIRLMIECAKRCDSLEIGRYYFDGNVFMNSVYYDHTLLDKQTQLTKEDLNENKLFDPIRDDPRFIELYNML